MRPTVDCKTCNQDGVDEKGDFFCKWRPVGGVRVVEGNRCWHVLESNKMYDKAVKESERLKNENHI